MQIIDLAKQKDKRNKELDKEFRQLILDNCAIMATGNLKLGIKNIENGLIKYKNSNVRNKCDAYRNICLAYELLEDNDNRMRYANKLKKILDENGNMLYMKHPDSYVMALNKVAECMKNTHDKRELIQINKRILQCARENNFDIDGVVAETNISFLRGEYEEVITILRNLHNNNYNFTKEDKDFLIEGISGELKEKNIKFYQKYKNDISLNKAIGL